MNLQDRKFVRRLVNADLAGGKHKGWSKNQRALQ